MTTQVQEKQAEDTLFGLTAKELANLHNWNRTIRLSRKPGLKTGYSVRLFFTVQSTITRVKTILILVR